MTTPTDERPKVYVVVEAQWKGGDVSGSLLLDTGEVMWGHMSSHIEWLKRDLTNGFTDRREALEARYPAGYELVVITEDGQIPDDVIERNKAWAEAERVGAPDA